MLANQLVSGTISAASTRGWPFKSAQRRHHLRPQTASLTSVGPKIFNNFAAVVDDSCMDCRVPAAASCDESATVCVCLLTFSLTQRVMEWSRSVWSSRDLWVKLQSAPCRTTVFHFFCGLDSAVFPSYFSIPWYLSIQNVCPEIAWNYCARLTSHTCCFKLTLRGQQAFWGGFDEYV